MHPSPGFQMSRDEAIASASRSGIGHLTTTVKGRIESVVVPFFIDTEDGSPTVYGHVSASNCQASSIEEGVEALLIVDGPIAYVSPELYPTKVETGKVAPTLSYLSVQIRGRLVPVTDSDHFRNLLASLTFRFEAGRDKPWSINDAPSDFIESLMRGIRGFSMQIDEIQGVAKHSQNRSESDRSSVRLSFAKGTDEERRIAALMV